MSHTEELLKVLEDTTRFLQELSIVEEEKFQAAMKNHILTLEECIKKEQAFVLRSKGLDLKRTSIQKAMGAETLTLKQIIETVDGEDKASLQAAFTELQKTLTDYQEIYHRAKTAIEVNLYRVNKQLEQMTGATPSYSEQGIRKQPAPGSFTSRRI